MDDQGAPPASSKGMYLPSFPEFTGHDSATGALDLAKSMPAPGLNVG